MKKITVIVTVSFLFAALWGCSGMEVLEDKPKEPTPSPIKEISEEEAMVEEDENSEDAEEDVLEQEIEEYEGNGTQFVKIDDKVYYREYDKEAMNRTVLWGDIHTYYPETGKRYIKCFDVNTGNVETAFEDDGFGPIYYLDGLFYLNGADGYYTVAPDGSNKNFLELKGTDPIFYGIRNGKIFFLDTLNGVDTLMWCLPDNSEPTKVCEIVEDEERGYPTISQVEVVGEDVYVGVSYIAGTGHFYQGGYIYKASLDGTGEPEEIRQMTLDDEIEDYICFKEDGSYDFVKHCPLSAWVDDKDIWVCEKDGTTKCVYSDLINDRKGLIKDYAEAVSYIDGSIYLIRDSLRYVKEDDIGWRESYKVLRSADVRIDSAGKINEFNIVKSDPETIKAYVYYLQEKADNNADQIIYQPILMVSRFDKEMCEKFGLDPENDDLFYESYSFVNPYYGEGFVGVLDDKLKCTMVNWEDPSGYTDGDKAELVKYLSFDEYNIYTPLSLSALSHDEYMDYYAFPEYNWEDESSPCYKSIFANVTFSDDGSTITNIEEIYIP